MIEHINIDGKPATVAYIDDKFNPVEKGKATLIKVMWDDGEQAILAAATAKVPPTAKAPPTEEEQKKRWLRARAAAHAALKRE